MISLEFRSLVASLSIAFAVEGCIMTTHTHYQATPQIEEQLETLEQRVSGLEQGHIAPVVPPMSAPALSSSTNQVNQARHDELDDHERPKSTTRPRLKRGAETSNTSNSKVGQNTATEPGAD